MRELLASLGVSRSVVTGLIAAGFVTPTRGPRNAWRFAFQDVVLLRTALILRDAHIPPRKINLALSRLREALPDELPLTGIRISAVGSDVAVRTGPSQWDAVTGQLLLDFEVAELRGDVVFLDSAPARTKRATQADEWYDLAERLRTSDWAGAERAYRKAIELSPKPFYAAYVDLGALLCELEARCKDALHVLDEALAHFPRDAVLHFNRAVALEDLERPGEAEQSYLLCLEFDPAYADAHHNLAILLEKRGDPQGLVRHLSAYRRLTT
ncbi:tetratricopeptide repeat protein [Paraburkholderia acidisoli]|uniref:Tetratricopeptide repeat protein n=1 Tax=Paraburkholderia acidisoli TaxID=2571748 RepID=A0A7Z2JKA6_9BURK|nr:tetratricopeptide repeat protein [Paraburkholderia acidisoli]QGZ67088.1 tetratricopeptide repeat protein [Paraburkholderia acidisoli]